MKISTSMRRFNIAHTIGGVALAALSLSGCVNRSENLDNLNVITKPYSLLFADVHGTIYSTYDGQMFDVIPNSQGVPMMGLGATDKYILLRPNASYLMVDDAGEGVNRNFNMSYSRVNPASFGPTFMLNLPDYNDTGSGLTDRLYVASDEGLAYSDSNGQTQTSWFRVTDPELVNNNGKITSLGQLDDKKLVAYDDQTRKIWIKNDLKSEWRIQESAGLPAGGNMFIITMKNDILAVMMQNSTDFGIWRSTDNGKTFNKLTNDGGLTSDVTCAIAAFDKVIIVGTASGGIWRFSGQGKWEQSSIGLKAGIQIYGLVYKSNKFKAGGSAENGKIGEYIYAATNDGVYRSDNLGQNWVRTEAPPTVKDINLIY